MFTVACKNIDVFLCRIYYQIIIDLTLHVSILLYPTRILDNKASKRKFRRHVSGGFVSIEYRRSRTVSQLRVQEHEPKNTALVRL